MRDKICRNEENGSHLLGALIRNFIPSVRRDEGRAGRGVGDAISVINKVRIRESRTLASWRVPISAAATATPVVALAFSKNASLDGERIYIYPIDMQTKFWIVKFA